MSNTTRSTWRCAWWPHDAARGSWARAANIAGTPLFAINTPLVGFAEHYALWRITNGARAGERAKPRVSHEIITTNGYTFAPPAHQKGSDKDIATLGHRMMAQVVYRDGQLWFAHASGCIFGSNTEDVFSCIRVRQLLPTGNGAAVGFEDLFGVFDHFAWMPGIAVTSGGDVVVAFQYGGKKKRLSLAYNGLKKGAARFGPARLPAGFDKQKFLASGKCSKELPEDEDSVRTGDYVGVTSDPSSTKDVWISGEFGAKVAGDCAWSSKIARVSY